MSQQLLEERWNRIVELEAKLKAYEHDVNLFRELAQLYQDERDQERERNGKLQAELIKTSELMRDLAKTRRFRVNSKLKTIHDSLRDVEIHVRSLLEMAKCGEESCTSAEAALPAANG